MNSGSDFKTLGLAPGASWDEVKSAFRRLARVYHPDVAGPDATRKFAEITEAYMTLKDSISPEASVGASARPANAGTAAESAGGSAGESFLKSLFKRLFGRIGREKDRSDTNEDIPPARIRFIGSAISNAESQMHTLLSRRGEVKARSNADAILRRIRSRHPNVVLLAIKRLSAHNTTDEIRTAIIEHFSAHAPSSEILEPLLALFYSSGQALDFAKALAPHVLNFTGSDANIVLKFLRRSNAPKSSYQYFFKHSSDSVAAAAIAAWPPNGGLPETSDILNLLKRDSEVVLIPLLRLLKKEKAPLQAMPYIVKISAEHKSMSARVWASAIVREQNLS